MHFRHKLPWLAAMRWGVLLVAIMVAAGPVGAASRRALGIYDSWGAFRSGGTCYALAEPADPSGSGRDRPFIAIIQAPQRGARGQVHVRLRAPKQRGRPVTLSIGDRHFALIAGGANAWARDAAQDAAIVAAMRSATSLSVETRGRDGRPMIEGYKLKGAASAIDAAALGCAPS